jgi:hypothetical protein
MSNMLTIIADLYTPLLLLCWIYYWQKELIQRRKSQFKRLLLLVSVVYALMLVDIYFGIWAYGGMDYSTHSAIALLLVVDLCFKNRLLLFVSPLSLCAYFYLIWLLNYHSIADMLTTCLLILPIFLYKKGK